MYSNRPNIILGFHGCDKSVAENVVLGKKELKFSDNVYDWLGHGIYFWENDYDRALEYAHEAQRRKPQSITNPSVLGAIITLGRCLDLTTQENIRILSHTYHNVIKPTMNNSNYPQLVNRQAGNAINGDLLLRDLDCYVIESLHKILKENSYPSYDSVKAAFWEGDELYRTAGFREKNHIQICIRNTQCILGYFLPRK